MNENMPRRDFLDWVIKGGLFATLAAMLIPALTYLWPVTRRGAATELIEVGTEDEIHVWGSKKVVIGGTALLVVRTPKEYKAFSAVCTHLGCIVSWNSERHQIECPCHAGFFDLEGRVISGPPPKPLPLHDVRVLNGKILVKP
jgi:cytochrome b6-f complex iron-sulfur subunit